MEEILVILLQFLFELIVLIELPFELIVWERQPEVGGIAGRCFLWLMPGCGVAGVTLLVHRHTYISVEALRMANLVAAPVSSGFAAKEMARRRARKKPEIVPRDHFWQAFWFTLGLVVVRFSFATRG